MKKYLMVLLLILLTGAVQAQQRKIVFKVTDPGDKPIAGVDILVGQTAKCRTDSTGKASLNWDDYTYKTYFRAVRSGYQSEAGIHVPVHMTGLDTLVIPVMLVPLNH